MTKCIGTVVAAAVWLGASVAAHNLRSQWTRRNAPRTVLGTARSGNPGVGCVFPYVRMLLGRNCEIEFNTYLLVTMINGFDLEVEKTKNFIFSGKLVKKLPRRQAPDFASSAFWLQPVMKERLLRDPVRMTEGSSLPGRWGCCKRSVPEPQVTQFETISEFMRMLTHLLLQVLLSFVTFYFVFLFFPFLSFPSIFCFTSLPLLISSFCLLI